MQRLPDPIPVDSVKFQTRNELEMICTHASDS